MSLLEKKESKKFISVLSSDGTLRMVVPEGTENGAWRDYELKDGAKGRKFELTFTKLEGIIENLDIYEGDWGKNILLDVKNGEEKCTLSLGTASPFGESFMKLFPNIDVAKVVSIEPYSFENDQKKVIKGLSIKQEGEKIKNFYFDSEAKKSINGIPEPEGDITKYDSESWKIHFLKVRKFLVGETEKLKLQKFPIKVEKPIDYPDDEIDPSKIPF